MKKIAFKVLAFAVCVSMIMPGPWCLPSYAGDEDAGETVQEEQYIEEAAPEQETQPAEMTEPEILEEEEKEEQEETAAPPAEGKIEEISEKPAEEAPAAKKFQAKEQIEKADIPDYTDVETDEIKGDVYNQYFATLLKDGKVSCTNEEVELAIDKTSKTMLVTGSKKNLSNAEFIIDKTFHFDGNAINRFSIDATAGYKQNIVLGFYLDGSDIPFTEVKLNKKKNKDKPWTPSKNISIAIDNPGITGEHTVSFKVLEASEKNTEFAIKDIEFCEGSVPVLYFNLDESDGDTIAAMNSSEDHSAECYGSMDIKVPEGCTSVDTGEALEGGSYELEYIRGRGNSTWDAYKKPYKIKLDKKSNLLGLGKNKHWVLIANHYDNSLLRNKITYWLGDQMGMAYTPDLEPVDVVMNGQYYGSYFLCEQIRIGENRVEIDDLEDTPEASEAPEVTGGYLLSMYPYGDENEKKSFATKKGVEYLIESPEFTEETNLAQYEYIKKYVQDVEDALYGENFMNEDGVSYRDLMDVESAAMYYWFQEFSMNGDGYGSTSTYLYKPRDGKLYWGPLWDFDYVAWGSIEYSKPEIEGWLHNKGYLNWNDRLFEDSEFANTVVKQWTEFKEKLEELTKEGGQLDKYAARMEITARYNFEKWGPTNLSSGWDSDMDNKDTEKVTLTYDEEIERLRTWIKSRTDWVDKNIESLKLVPAKITFKTYNGKKIKDMTAYEGRTLRDIPEGPARKGYLFEGWEYEFSYTLEEYIKEIYDCTYDEFIDLLKEWKFTDKEIKEEIESMKSELTGRQLLESYTTIHDGMVFKAKYINEKDIVPVKKIYFTQDKYYGVYEGRWGEPICIRYSVAPYNAFTSGLKITSSNEDVVAMDEERREIVPKGPGDAIVTVTAPNGVSASVPVHIYTEDEYDSMGCPDAYEGTVEAEVTINKGSYRQLKMEFDETEGRIFGDFEFISANPSVADVSDTGLIRGVKAGTATILCSYMGKISICKVTVKDSSIRAGSKVTVNGVRYEVIKKGKRIGQVKVLGPKSKTLTKAVIPAEIKIKKKPYKVVEIKNDAFKDCRSLKNVVIGRNVELIGKNAFKNCKKLTSVKINARKAKAYGGAFAGISGKAVFKVQKRARKFYSYQLGKKKLKTFSMMDVGRVYKVNGVKYQITCMDSNLKTVSVNGPVKKTAKKLVVPASVKINKKAFKVTGISRTALKNKKKLRTVVIKAPKLKNAGKAFLNANSKVIVKVPRKNLDAYRKAIKNRKVRAI